MLEFISQPWPWYVAGPLLGLLVPFLLLLVNKPFGISSTMMDVCALYLPTSKIKFFQYDVKAWYWNLVFALGVIVGAFMVMLVFPNPEVVQISEGAASILKSRGITDLNGLVPIEIFSWEAVYSPVGIIMLGFGGFLVGFGTRYAGGCTSGHAIMGMSMLSLSSFISVCGFFVGGLFMTWVILPAILKSL